MDVFSDNANCGRCGGLCLAGTECRFVGYAGVCVPAGCGGMCSGSPQTGCGLPTKLSRESKATVAIELNKDDLRGVAYQQSNYACENAGCAWDFAQRCPNCTVATNVVGLDVTSSVQEMELR